ncbi:MULTISPECIES: hypothetical protein [Pseudomonas]|uniref:Uncharacterized protein n=1 Tax=Pseudomonas nunensis TaxID=2961896 RepID=A0ABY5ELJ7_9PSED|nr:MULTISPECIES: hypothetical protein [Pseudomonas]KPN94125.1 hypothetical protein AL066_04525 [Pseudomonas nunensis]MCL5230646.1 hypothetical protein [Pseudomonas nunensis]MEB0222943.1 hypothetical protein [Pseudomonas sp. 5S1]MEB0293013.1 hypothetical protein [Pseudomonas sp. 10S4]UTO15660.1 hypothetical protein NK667_04655 [Pseudomonas nunensis]
MTDRARLSYLNDTLFGPIAKTIECDVLITPITPGAFQVQVMSPVPDDLHKAHSLTIILSSGGQRLNGTVAHARRLENADLELQIDT